MGRIGATEVLVLLIMVLPFYFLPTCAIGLPRYGYEKWVYKKVFEENP